MLYKVTYACNLLRRTWIVISLTMLVYNDAKLKIWFINLTFNVELKIHVSGIDNTFITVWE